MTSGQVKTSELIGNLTPKQEAFCLHYLACGNGSEAIRRAGYDTENPDVLAAENLVKPSIISRLTALRERVGLSEERTIDALAQRKRRLQEIVDHAIETPVSAGHRVAAAKELNLMERVYADQHAGQPPVINVTYVFNQAPNSAQNAHALPETPPIKEIEGSFEAKST